MVRYGEYSPRNPNIVSSDKPVLDLGEYEEKRRLLLEKKKREYQQQMTQENSLVRYGEYSPRNPTAVSLDKPVLGLGEYEEKRRMMMEQMKREYKQQMTQARISLNTPRKEKLLTDPSQINRNVFVQVTDVEQIASVGTGNINRDINTASTQTDSSTEEFQLDAPTLQNATTRIEFGDGVAPDVSDLNQHTHESYNTFGSDLSPMVALTLTVPDEASGVLKFQSISPRERKLADLRGSDGYSPSFYESRTHRGGTQDFAGRTLHTYQPTDQVPDARLRRQVYQEELRQQIEEKHRLEALQKAKERKEEETIMKRVEQQQEKMRLEYEQEKAQRQIRQAQRLHLAEQFQRREEELKWEAQQEREEEMRRKRGLYYSETKESQLNENNNFLPNHKSLAHSLPVPALRTKLLSHFDPAYQSPKEITQILGGNFPKTLNYQEPAHALVKQVHSSSKKLDETSMIGTHTHQSPRPPNNTQRRLNLEQSFYSKFSNDHVKSSIIGPELHHQNLGNGIPVPSIHSKSPVVLAVQTVAAQELQTVHSDQAFAHNEATNCTEVNREVPVQKNVLRTADVISEARPTNILTQLGAFRRQMQIDQKKMEEELQKKLQEKASSV